MGAGLEHQRGGDRVSAPSWLPGDGWTWGEVDGVTRRQVVEHTEIRWTARQDQQTSRFQRRHDVVPALLVGAILGMAFVLLLLAATGALK